MPKKSQFKIHIRKIRKQRGWSIEKFTKKFQRERNDMNLKNDMDFIRCAETGFDVCVDEVQALAAALNVKMADLYSVRGGKK